MQCAVLRIISGNNAQKNRQKLIEDHQRLLERNKGDCYAFLTTFEHENLQLKLEDRISIADLQVNNHVPMGKFLLCRVITKCFCFAATITIVEDLDGNVKRLILYNWAKYSPLQSNKFPIKSSSLLPIGTQIVIKNPSYKLAADNNKMIYLDNPKDIIIIDHNIKLFNELRWSTDPPGEEKFEDEIKKSANDFRCSGNNYFALKDYKSAIYEYNCGIELEPQNITLLAN